MLWFARKEEWYTIVLLMESASVEWFTVAFPPPFMEIMLKSGRRNFLAISLLSLSEVTIVVVRKALGLMMIYLNSFFHWV